MRTPEFFYRHAGLGGLLATLTNAIALFAVFRLAYIHLGPSVVGTWALIQAIMIVSRIGDSGSGGNITRLVAIDRNNQGAVALRNFIATGLLVGTGPLMLLGLPVIPVAYYYISGSYAETSTLPVFGLTLCSLIFGVLNSTAMILSGCLDGLGLMALRGYLSTLANILFIPIMYIAIARLGDVGLGVAYDAYATVLIILTGSGIALFNPKVGPSYQVQRVVDLCHKTVRFNFNFLLISLCQLLLDPTSKLLVGQFGNLNSVAIFDIANKVTSQVRILFQATIQSTLPLLSREESRIEDTMHARLLNWNKIVARLAFYAMSLVVLSSGYLSLLSLGHVDKTFMLYVMVLACGNAVNAAGLVGYYAEVGSGHLKRLLALFVTLAASNAGFGLLFGYLFGAVGIVAVQSTNVAWAGIAMARAIFGSAKETTFAIVREVRLEVAVFVFTVASTWSLMLDLHRSSPVLASVLLAIVGVAVGLVLSFRERQFVLAFLGHYRAQ